MGAFIRAVPRQASGTMVQGNPAVPIAHCGVPLTAKTKLMEFYLKLTPLPPGEGSENAR